MSFAALLPRLVLASGIGQLTLVLGSLAIPRVLSWRDQTAVLRPLLRQLFWTYAAYIWFTNFCFGLVSALAPHVLLDRSALAGAVTGFMAVYWGGRLTIQFAYFDRSDAPGGLAVRLAEVALVSLFTFLMLVYGCATVFNLRGLAA